MNGDVGLTYATLDRPRAVFACGALPLGLRVQLDRLSIEIGREPPHAPGSVLIVSADDTERLTDLIDGKCGRVIVAATEGTAAAALDALDQGAADVISEGISEEDLARTLGISGAQEISFGQTPRLSDLTMRMASLAQELETLARAPDILDLPAGPPALTGAKQVRAMLKARRARANHFPPDLFADPAWDILLDLYAAKLEAKPVSVSSVCIAAAVPATTALRWIKTLTDAGMIERTPDPIDGRRVFLEISDKAAEAMGAYLARQTLPAPLAA